MKKPIVYKLFLFLLFITVNNSLHCQENTIATLSIQPLTAIGNKYLCDQIADTVQDTLILTLGLLGKYEIKQFSKELWEEKGFEQMVNEYHLDNVIMGKIIINEDNQIDLSLQLYTRKENQINEPVKAQSKTLMGVFDITDQLVVKLIESFTDEHLELGSLYLDNIGPKRTFSVEIDGKFAGRDKTDFSMIPAGEHSIEIYETINHRRVSVTKETIQIDEGEVSYFTFSLITEELYQEYLKKKSVQVINSSFLIDEIPNGYMIPKNKQSSPGPISLSNFEIANNVVSNQEYLETLLAGMEKINRNEKNFISPQADPPFLKIQQNGLYYVDKNQFINRKILDFNTNRNFKNQINSDGKELILLIEDYDLSITNITWFGALLYCNLRSYLEDLDPSYDLKKMECRFSEEGYRLPTEAEYQFVLLDKNTHPEKWEKFELPKVPQREWLWDWFSNKVKIKKGEERDVMGPGAISGMILTKSETERKAQFMGTTSNEITFRWVKNIDATRSETQEKKHPSFSKHRHYLNVLAGYYIFNDDSYSGDNIQTVLFSDIYVEQSVLDIIEIQWPEFESVTLNDNAYHLDTCYNIPLGVDYFYSLNRFYSFGAGIEGVIGLQSIHFDGLSISHAGGTDYIDYNQNDRNFIFAGGFSIKHRPIIIGNPSSIAVGLTINWPHFYFSEETYYIDYIPTTMISLFVYSFIAEFGISSSLKPTFRMGYSIGFD